MRRAACAALALALLLPAVPGGAASQDAKSAKARAAQDDAVRATYRAVACVMRRAPQLRSTLRTLPGAPDMGIMLRRAQLGECLYNMQGLRMNNSLLRGVIAEAMLKSDLRGVGVAAGWVAPVFADPGAGPGAPAPAESYSVIELDLLRTMECAVRAAPEAAFAIFATEVRSPEERAAVRIMAPVIGKCLVAGRSLTFDATLVRGYLAEATYRVSAAMLAQNPAAR